MRSGARKTAEEKLAFYGEPPTERQRARVQFLLVSFLVVFTLIFVRLAQLHLNPRLELTAEEKMHFGEVVLQEPRGEIFDRNGLLMATSKDLPSLWVDPRAVENPDELSIAISAKLGIPEPEVMARLTQRDKDGNLMKFVPVKRWIAEVPEEELQELEALGAGAVAIQYESLRFYPQGETAAHLMGFVNRNGEAAEGVEAAFDKYLKSVPGKKIARKDARRRLLESQIFAYEEPKGGDMLQLTLDSTIQHSLEVALDKRMEQCNAPRAMGVVMDPHTGAILALAVRPAFDPNRYDEFDPELRKNRALIDVFEPGSAFKIVTASAVLEHGLVTPETMIDCEGGAFNPYGHRIRDFHKFNVIPFSKCFEESSNIAMIKVAAMLGAERFEEWIRRYGFGEQTSRNFPYESRGIFAPRDKWSRLSMGSLPMGQEISVTMLQLAKSFSVVANGGHLVEPYFVERAVNREGETTYQHDHVPPTRILSESTAQTMKQLCAQVVMHGTGEPAAMPEYTAGGKTGTAQMALPNGRGYDPDRYTTVFAGFAPATDPRLVAVIVVQEPMIRSHYGGFVCGPVFRDVVRESLIRMNVPMDKQPEAEDEKKAPAKPKPLPEPVLMAKAEEKPAVEDVDTVVERVTIEEMESSMEALIEPLDELELLTAAAANNRVGELPDLTGLSKREALAQLSEMGIGWDAQGAGWVSVQNPPPGTPLREVSLCALQFSPSLAVPADEQERSM